MYADILDAESDFYDGGSHVNYRGGNKVTDYIGNYLLQNCNNITKNTKNPDFEDALNAYHKIADLSELHAVTDFNAFLDEIIENKNNWTVYVSSVNGYSSGLSEHHFKKLEEVGLHLITEGNHSDTYLAVIDGGNVLYEGLSDRRLTHNMNLHGHNVSMTATSYMDTTSGTAARISIDGTNYSLSAIGLNFVIWDKEADRCILNISFGTNEKECKKTVSNDWLSRLLWEYEDEICF